MYWYRLERSLGHNSLVGTTIQAAERLPRHLVAVARKLLVIANAVVRSGRPWQPDLAMALWTRSVRAFTTSALDS